MSEEGDEDYEEDGEENVPVQPTKSIQSITPISAETEVMSVK
jgi:hypothetical protein